MNTYKDKDKQLYKKIVTRVMIKIVSMDFLNLSYVFIKLFKSKWNKMLKFDGLLQFFINVYVNN